MLKQLENQTSGFMGKENGDVVDLYHKAIEGSNNKTEHNFDKFKMITTSTDGISSPGKPFQSFGSTVSIKEYTGKLSSAIGEIYGMYFYDKTNPLDGSPSTIIKQIQNQSQNQSVHIEIITQIRYLIDQNLQKANTLKKNNFFNKIKEGLKNTTDIHKLILLILETSKNVGLSITDTYKLLS